MQLLDHGYCNLVESWGSDERVIEAARMSTAKGFQGWGPIHEAWCQLHPQYHENGCTPKQGDEKLLRYLWTHKHYTPFEMAGMIVEVQAPLFVAREWMRHRASSYTEDDYSEASYNELSARYTELPNLFYIPSVERLRNSRQSHMNKQGSAEGFTEKDAFALQGELVYATTQARIAYKRLLAMEVSREVSRLIVPVNQYTRFRVSASLRNWLHFLGLRLGEGVQWEMAEYARAIAHLVEKKFPRTWALFAEANEKEQ